MDEHTEIDEMVKEQFRRLPKVVQQAIVSADVEKQLRELADKHNLHLDQWGILEDQVQMTLLGIKHNDELAANIQSELALSAEEAQSLAADVSRIVFEPIRQELERQLEHPDAKAAAVSDTEAVRQQMLTGNAVAAQEELTPASAAAPVAPATPAAPAAPTVAPATPPTPPPATTAERAPIASTYQSTASHERKEIEGDPYREQVK